MSELIQNGTTGRRLQLVEMEVLQQLRRTTTRGLPESRRMDAAGAGPRDPEWQRAVRLVFRGPAGTLHARTYQPRRRD